MIKEAIAKLVKKEDLTAGQMNGRDYDRRSH